MLALAITIMIAIVANILTDLIIKIFNIMTKRPK